MPRKEHTEEALRLAKEAREKLVELHELLRAGGDVARAMDVSESIEYLDGALED